MRGLATQLPYCAKSWASHEIIAGRHTILSQIQIYMQGSVTESLTTVVIAVAETEWAIVATKSTV
jgi:hypothetical protein